MATQN